MMPDLPTSHRVPVSWLRANASAPLKWRTLKDILPPGAAAPEDYAAVQAEVLESKQLQLVIKKQRKSGLWGDNVLGLAPNKTAGYKDVGTVSQYRRLVELGMPREDRVFRPGSASRSRVPAPKRPRRTSSVSNVRVRSPVRDLVGSAVRRSPEASRPRR